MKKENTKIVIFDWGGVVERHKNGEYNCFTARVDVINKLAKNKLDADLIIEKCNKCDYNNETNKYISEINTKQEIQQWFKKQKEIFDLQCNYEEFYNVYQEEFDKVEYYKDVIKFAHSLKDKCKIGILSNLCSFDSPRIDKHYNLSKFDYVWLSFEMNCRKPNEEIYIMVENDCKIKPKNILFIDDAEENINIAKKREWNVCLANGHELDKIKQRVAHFLK